MKLIYELKKKPYNLTFTRGYCQQKFHHIVIKINCIFVSHLINNM